MQLIQWSGGQEVQAQDINQAMRSEGYAITAHPIVKHLPDIPTTSDEDESFWLVKGKLEFNLANQNVTLNAGDRLLVPKGSKYRLKALSDSAFYLLGKKIEPKK